MIDLARRCRGRRWRARPDGGGQGVRRRGWTEVGRCGSERLELEKRERGPAGIGRRLPERLGLGVRRYVADDRQPVRNRVEGERRRDIGGSHGCGRVERRRPGGLGDRSDESRRERVGLVEPRRPEEIARPCVGTERPIGRGEDRSVGRSMRRVPRGAQPVGEQRGAGRRRGQVADRARRDRGGRSRTRRGRAEPGDQLGEEDEVPERAPGAQHEARGDGAGGRNRPRRSAEEEGAGGESRAPEEPVPGLPGSARGSQRCRHGRTTVACRWVHQEGMGAVAPPGRRRAAGGLPGPARPGFPSRDRRK